MGSVDRVVWTFLGPLVTQFITEVAVDQIKWATSDLFGRFIQLFGKKAEQTPHVELLELLQGLTKLPSSKIDQMIACWEKESGRKISDEVRRDLHQMLLSLSMGANYLTTQGRPSSAWFRSECLLRQLLEGIAPVRSRGEPVGNGFESWVLKDFLGRGAFGEVWSAQFEGGHNWTRAYKFFTQSDAQEWVRREKNNLLALKDQLPTHHPNIVSVENISTNQEYPFIEFEYVEGGSLEQWISEDVDVRPSLEPQDTIRGLLNGLAAAHAKGIYHRDLKPANILLTNGEVPVPKLTDFGLATFQTSEHLMRSAQQSQTVLAGTPMYLPPEFQKSFAQPNPAKQDVFALGVIWYQLAVNRLERPPYNFAERLAEHGVDSYSVLMISRCLADPDRRFQDAVELNEHVCDTLPPNWTVPNGCVDVQPIFREFVARERAELVGLS